MNEVENSIPKTLLCEMATLKYHVATIANLYQFIIQNDGDLIACGHNSRAVATDT